MGTLAISAANLDTIENNMAVLNNNINSVTSDIININGKINDFDDQVSSVKNIVSSLEEELRSFMGDIRSNTIVSNAQNDILLKESELNRKYINYTSIRNDIKGLIGSIKNNKINRNIIESVSNQSVIKAPNFYLSYVIKAIYYWFLDDKANSNANILQALNLNSNKTCLIMCLICMNLGRNKASEQWLKKYLDTQNGNELDNNFIMVLDAFINNAYDNSMQDMIITQINEFINNIDNKEMIETQEIERWRIFFRDTKKKVNIDVYPGLKTFSDNSDMLFNSLENSYGYYNAYFKFEELIKNVKTDNKTSNNLINNLVDTYENEELILKQSVMKDKLIIKNNGDMKKTDEEYRLSSLSYQNSNNFYTLMSNILIDRNDLSENTKHFACYYLRDILNRALSEELNSDLDDDGFTTILINDWREKSLNGSNELELKDSLKTYLRNPFDNMLSQKTYFDTRIIISVLAGLISLVISIGINFSVGIVLFMISLIALILFIIKVGNERELIEIEFNEMYKKYELILENVLAEIVDINFIIKRNKENYNYFKDYINSFNAKEYYESEIR